MTADSQSGAQSLRLLSEHPLLKHVTSFLPLHVLRPLRAELHLTAVRRRGASVRRSLRGKREALVNVGCGDCGKSGWVNIDGWAAPGVTHVYDCRKSMPLEDGAARGIFTEHFVEHLHYGEEVPRFFAECYRVLQPGGVLRVIVPDTEGCMRGYFQEGWLEREHERGQHGDTPMERINEHFRQDWQHKFAYDYETLALKFRRAGFQKVVRQEFGSSLMPDLCIDAEHRRDGSLYVEGQK